MRYRFLNFFFILIFFSLLIITCRKDEVNSRNYPRVRTIGVSEIDAKGIKVSGTIYTSGKEEVIEYGFAWSKYQYFTLSDNQKIVGNQQPVGVFSARINYGLETGLDYYVCAYARTKSQTIFGNAHKFKSQGSEPPVVYSIEPDTATWLDTITIKGRGFSSKVYFNTAKIGGVQCQVIACTDTSLIVSIAPDVLQYEADVAVTCSGQTAINKPILKLIKPIITSISPQTGDAGTKIIILGKNFHPNKFANIVLFDAIAAPITNSTTTKIETEVPAGLSKKKSNVALSIGDYVINALNDFHNNEVYIKSISPATGTFGDTITISGTNFTYNPVSISFGNTMATVSSINDSVINVTVPEILTDSISTVNINSTDGITKSQQKFRLLPPIIDSVTILEDNMDIVLSIKGRNFNPNLNYNTIDLNGYMLKPLTGSSLNTLLVRYPNEHGFIFDNLIGVRVFIGEYYSNTEVFRLQPPQIIDFEPKSGGNKARITINGENFHSIGFSLYLNNVECEYIPVSSKQVIAILPLMEQGDYQFSISVSRQGTKSSTSFQYNSSCKLYSEFPGADWINAFRFTINGKFYMGGGITTHSDQGNNDLWQFDPATKIWTQKADYIGAIQTGLANFTIDKFGYVGNGKFWRYDSELNEWKQIASAPTSTPAIYNAMCFAISGKGYFGFGGYPDSRLSKWIYYKDVFEYDPQSDTWTTKKSKESLCSVATSLSFDNNGYMVGGLGDSNSFWEYNPSADSWVRKRDFPVSIEGCFSFVINNEMYVCGTENNLGLIYKYNRMNNSWIKISNLPFSLLSNPCSSVYENKCYFVFARSNFNRLMYEFDPALL